MKMRRGTMSWTLRSTRRCSFKRKTLLGNTGFHYFNLPLNVLLREE
jgi:hypothetical protein